MLSIDLFNGLLLFIVKALCILTLVHWLVELSRDLSAAVAHCLLIFAAAAVFSVPLISPYLPHLSLALVPQAMAEWLQLPVVIQTNGQLTYNIFMVAATSIYLITAVWFLFYFATGIAQVARINCRARLAPNALKELVADLSQRLQLHRTPLVKISDEVASPQVFAAGYPVVLLPCDYAGWSGDRLRRVLVHELAHIKRRDWPLKMMLHCLAAILWFVPFIWHTLRRSAWYAELACDDYVVLLEGGRAEYADDLLALSMEAAPTPIGAVALGNTPDLYLRIQAVLDVTRNRRPLTLAESAWHGFLMVLLLIPLASVNAVVHTTESFVAHESRQRSLFIFNPISQKPPVEVPPAVSPEKLVHLRDVLLADMDPPPGPRQIITVARQHSPEKPEVPEKMLVFPEIRIESGIDIHGARVLTTQMPQYPRRALRSGIEGRVTVQFDVGADGLINDLKIIDATPDGVFDRSVAEAIHQFRFLPQRVNGYPVITKNVTETFVFKLLDGSTTDNQPTRISSDSALR